jgi:hypothetical protein
MQPLELRNQASGGQYSFGNRRPSRAGTDQDRSTAVRVMRVLHQGVFDLGFRRARL